MYECGETGQIIQSVFCSSSLTQLVFIQQAGFGMEVFGVNAGKLPCAEIGARRKKTNKSSLGAEKNLQIVQKSSR